MIVQRASGPDIAPPGRRPERSVPARRPGRAGIVLVGVLGGSRRDRAAVTEALAPAAGPDTVEVIFLDQGSRDVDAVLFVADGGSPLTDEDQRLLRAVSADDRPLLLVLTGIDRHPHWHDVLTSDLAGLRQIGVVAEPFAISTRLHGVAASSHDQELEIASGVPALAGRILDLAGSDHADPAGPEGFGVVTRLRPVRARSAPGRGRERAGEKRRPPTGRSVEGGPTWQQVLGDGFAAASSDVEYDLKTRVRTVQAEAEQAVDDGDPGRGWAEFDTGLRDRLVRELQQTHALLTERVDGIAAMLGDHLGGPAPNTVVRPLPAGPELFAHVSRRAPTASGRPLATRGQALMRAAYGGILMSFVVPRISGLRIPLWVLGAAAAVTAVAFIVATVLGERKRRLDRLRSQARTIVRQSTDGFLLSAGKHTRDTLRAAQQQLRDDCAARMKQPRPPDVVPLRPWQPSEPNPELPRSSADRSGAATR